MKIIKRQFNITPFIDEHVFKYLKEKNMLDIYVINLLNFIERHKNTEGLIIYFPFVIGSFTWSLTPEGSVRWIEAHTEIDRKAKNTKLLFLKDVIKKIGYENS